MPEALAFFRGKMVPLSEAKVSVTTHALHYGTAVFEGIRGNWNEEQGKMFVPVPRNRGGRPGLQRGRVLRASGQAPGGG